jgi:transposase-like protein
LKSASLVTREAIVKSKRRRRAEWIKLCDAHATSGESIRAFARRHGLNWRTLGWWRTKLRREGALSDRGASFVEVLNAPPAAAPQTVVRVGAVAIEFSEGLPPIGWLVELASRC